VPICRAVAPPCHCALARSFRIQRVRGRGLGRRVPVTQKTTVDSRVARQWGFQLDSTSRTRFGRPRPKNVCGERGQLGLRLLRGTLEPHLEGTENISSKIASAKAAHPSSRSVPYRARAPLFASPSTPTSVEARLASSEKLSRTIAPDEENLGKAHRSTRQS
jgi:hypothetical protein